MVIVRESGYKLRVISVPGSARITQVRKGTAEMGPLQAFVVHKNLANSLLSSMRCPRQPLTEN